jgi:hypothetical protein
MLTGKSRDQCILALRAAQGVPDVAYEILSSGMPLTQEALNAAEGDDYGDEGDEDASVGSNLSAGSNPFAALASNPNFGLIRQRIL